MKNIWKWIIGIVVVVVVVAGLVGLGFVVHNAMAANASRRQAAFSARATAFSAQSQPNAQGTPAAPQTQTGPQSNLPGGPRNGFMGRGFPGFRGPDGQQMMPRGGYDGFNGHFGGRPGFYGGMPMAFGPGMMILGGLGRLVLFGFFVLLLVGAYLLGRNSRAPAPSVVAAPAAVATHACPKCGSLVPDDAKYCPACGKKQ